MARVDIIVLFSGGLDSLLTAKLLQSQGLSVRCLHCVSPFFGDIEALPRWRRLHGLDIVPLEVGDDFVSMLRAWPTYGFGKVMNPCVDCKILLLRRARDYMVSVGAKALASGAVLGQRPMSQRRDTLHIIQREAGVAGLLLRPLSAKLLPPTESEISGLVDRDRLLDIHGRGRTAQLALARSYNLAEIPTPGGGCRLTERENARRYWPVLTRRANPAVADFALANLGRQFWREQDNGVHWLVIGRNQSDNQRLAAAAGPQDLLLEIMNVSGPLALARDGIHWPAALLAEAAAQTASYAPKARSNVCVRAAAHHGKEARTLTVTPARSTLWMPPSWAAVREDIRAAARARQKSGKP